MKAGIANREVHLSSHSRVAIGIIRYVLRPLIKFFVTGGARRFAVFQFLLAKRQGPALKSGKLPPTRFGIFGSGANKVAGMACGSLDPAQGPVLLWLHGGAWVMPIIPENHVATAARLAQTIGGSAFLPEYRLLPSQPFPAGLDDCEKAYNMLLESGFAPGQIAIGGDSAGGNLTFALLHRLRRNGGEMPAAAVGVAPVTDLACFPHGSPARVEFSGSDAVLPVTSLTGLIDRYCGDHDRSHPEISPLYGDFNGFPPVHLVCSAHEYLRDDSVFLAQQLEQASVPVTLDVWPSLPHIFPLCEDMLPEARESREDIGRFLCRHLNQSMAEAPAKAA